MKITAFLFALLLAVSYGRWTTAQPAHKPTPRAWYCGPCNNSCDIDAYSAAGTCRHCGMALVQRPVAEVDALRRQLASAAAHAPKRRNVAILVFKGMEILDFAGPSEVFGTTAGFNVYTVALTAEPVLSEGFVTITPQYTLATCPAPDIVVLPGGSTDPLLKEEKLIRWVQAHAAHAEVMLSVCTGAGVLGKAGLLDGKQVTTFHNYIDALQQANPTAKVLRGTRYVDNGQVVTTAGISAGIDGSLHVVARLLGDDVARQTALNMEYDKWQPNQGLVVKATTPAISRDGR